VQFKGQYYSSFRTDIEGVDEWSSKQLELKVVPRDNIRAVDGYIEAVAPENSVAVDREVRFFSCRASFRGVRVSRPMPCNAVHPCPILPANQRNRRKGIPNNIHI